MFHSSDILESDGYFPNLLSMAGAANIDCPKMPTHSGQDENYQAKGVVSIGFLYA